MLSIRTDFQAIKDTLENLTTQAGNQLWLKVATKIYSKIVRNIQRGLDVNGQPFRDYSPTYKQFRTDNGLGLTVNLQFTSLLYRSITVEADDTGFVIYISGQDNIDKANSVQKGGRIFLDWGTDIQKAFNRAIVQEINDIFGS
jgi:hypothetical protein